MTAETHHGMLTVPIGSVGRNGNVATVTAEFSDDELFAVHETPDSRYLFTVTHVPTLRAMTRIQESREAAWAVVERLRGMGWNWARDDVRYFLLQQVKLSPKQSAWLTEVGQ